MQLGIQKSKLFVAVPLASLRLRWTGSTLWFETGVIIFHTISLKSPGMPGTQ